MSVLRWLEHVLQDLKYALRTLRRTPGFTALAVGCLALGIGANTAIFTLINAVMLRELPVHHPAALVIMGNPARVSSTTGSERTDIYSYPMFREVPERNHAPEPTSLIWVGVRREIIWLPKTDTGTNTVLENGERSPFSRLLTRGEKFRRRRFTA